MHTNADSGALCTSGFSITTHQFNTWFPLWLSAIYWFCGLHLSFDVKTICVDWDIVTVRFYESIWGWNESDWRISHLCLHAFKILPFLPWEPIIKMAEIQTRVRTFNFIYLHIIITLTRAASSICLRKNYWKKAMWTSHGICACSMSMKNQWHIPNEHCEAIFYRFFRLILSQKNYPQISVSDFSKKNG